MKSSRTHPTVPLAELLPGVLKDLKGEKRLSLEEIQAAWEKLVGKRASAHSWPRTLRSRRLLVEAENSGWMYTLNLSRPRLLQGLIERFGANRIKELSFRIGEEKETEWQGKRP